MEVGALVGPEEIVGINTQVNLSRPQGVLASWHQAAGTGESWAAEKLGQLGCHPRNHTGRG